MYLDRQIENMIDTLATPKTLCWYQCRLKNLSYLEKMLNILFCLETNRALLQVKNNNIGVDLDITLAYGESENVNRWWDGEFCYPKARWIKFHLHFWKLKASHLIIFLKGVVNAFVWVQISWFSCILGNQRISLQHYHFKGEATD